MISYNVGYGGYTLTTRQLSILTNDLSTAQSRNQTDLGLGSQIYKDILEFVTDSSGQRSSGVDANSYAWIVGASGVNNDSTLAGDFIRFYTVSQLEIQKGISDVDVGLLNVASNLVAENFASLIITDQGALPDIVGIATADAGAAASSLFDSRFDPWAGTLLFPFIGASQFYYDWIMNPQAFQATIHDYYSQDPKYQEQTRTFETSGGMYSLISSIESSMFAATQAGFSNPLSAAKQLLTGPSNATTPNQTQIATDTSAFFLNYYGLLSNSEFKVGADTVFAGGSPIRSYLNYKVGALETSQTLYGNSGIQPSVIIGGNKDDIIYATTSSDDLIDGGDGNNKIHAGSGRDIIFGGSYLTNIIYGNTHSALAGGDSYWDIFVGGPGGTTTGSLLGQNPGPTDHSQNLPIGYQLPDQSKSSYTFYEGNGSAISIGGLGSNKFVIDSKNYKPDVNIVWGGGGTSEYDLIGTGNRVVFYQIANPTTQSIENLELSLFKNPAYQGLYESLTVIINPSSNDKLVFNGTTLKGGSYLGPQDNGEDYGGADGLVYSPFLYPVGDVNPDGFSVFTPSLSQYAIVEGFINSELGITFQGDGPWLTADDKNSAVLPKFFNNNDQARIKIGNSGSSLSSANGNSILQGTDNTTFNISQGDGSVTLYNTYLSSGGIISFDPSFDKSTVIYTADGTNYQNLVISNGQGDSVEIDSILGSAPQSISSFRFSTGTNLSLQDVLSIISNGSASQKYLFGTYSADVLDSHGFALFASGSGGGDTFIYNSSYGQLEISEVDTTDSINSVQFGTGITATQINVTSDSSGNVYLTDGTAGDKIELDGELRDDSHGVQSLKFADGSSLSKLQIVAMINNVSVITAGPSASVRADDGATKFLLDGANNSVFAGNGDDEVTGGIDSATYGNGGDTITLGNGNDIVQEAGGYNSITVGNGNNTINAPGDFETVTAGDGSNDVTLAGYADIVAAGDGSNTIDAGAASSIQLTLGSGANTVTLGGYDDMVTAGTLTQPSGTSDAVTIISSGVARSTIIGGNNNLEVTLNGQDHRLIAGNGTDLVGGATDFTTIALGDGNDTVSLTGSNNTVSVGNGTSSIAFHQGYNTVQTGSGTTSVTLDAYGNTVLGGDGSNSVTGGQGNDAITLGDGDNTVQEAGAYDTITVGNGNNTINAPGDFETVTAGNGSNQITLAGYADIVAAGNGSNTIVGNVNNANLTLGTGNNVVGLHGYNNEVTASQGTATIDAGDASAIIRLSDVAASVILHGNNNIVYMQNSQVNLMDNSANTTIVVADDRVTGVNVTDTISDFKFSTGSIVELMNGLGAFQTPEQVVQALTPDDQGGTLLTLSPYLTIDLLNVNLSDLSVANFKIG